MTEIVQNPIVIKSIIAANKAAGSMLSHCKNAAEIASAEFDATKTPKENIESVAKTYATAFTGLDANVKQNFMAYLTLAAGKNTPVTITKKVDGENVDIHTTAGEMLSKPGTSKHVIRDIAKQVREAIGTAREAGGGAKKKTTAPATFPAAPDMTDETAFLAWCDNLSEYLLDAVYRPRIDARLIEMGLLITKTQKGKVVKGTASA